MKLNRLEEQMKDLRGEEWIKGIKQQALLFRHKQLEQGQLYVTRQGSLVEIFEVLADAVWVRFQDGFLRKMSHQKTTNWYLYDKTFLTRVDSKTRTRFEVKKLRKQKQQIFNSSHLSEEEKSGQIQLLNRMIFDLWEMQNRYGN